MMMKIAAAVMAVPVAAVATIGATGVVVVDVREGGPQGHHIVVPMPLLAARAAAAFVPEEKTRLHLDPEAARHLPLAREAVLALAQAPDCELVRVEQEGEQVVIRKQGQMLAVHVRNEREEVRVNVPLEMVLQVLPGPDGRLSPGAAVAALGSARFTDLVEVKSADGDRVKITVW